MKKSKFAIVIALGLVLCLLCGVTTTFSWFSRPREESGNSLRWSGQYKISNGQDISIKTVESSDDGTTFDENPVTDFGGSLEAGKRRYFCTEISNSGNTEQNVSLFIKNLKTSGTASASGLYVGVNKPLKTYRSYNDIVGSNSTYTKTSLEKYRFYLDTNNVSSWKDSTTTIKIRYGTGDVETPKWQGNPIVMTPISGQSTRVLYVDVPKTAKVVQFYANNKNTGANATPYMLLTAYCPTLPVDNCYKFTLQTYTSGNYDNHNCNTYSFNNPLTDCANFINCYDSINIPLGRTFNAGLVAGTDYVGNSISYSSSKKSVFTVDANGVITPVAEGNATLTTTITGGEYGDTYSVTTKISVTSASSDSIDTPIVTNLEIKPRAADGPTVSKVYWYIKNDSSSTITYSLKDVYISL
ncbi:hypothetical protein DW960_05335 [Ruminococcus bromii]|jgi:hypothetical protein|nr:hypothetical protein DW960_05335 [Ruminococcus bromii]